MIVCVNAIRPQQTFGTALPGHGSKAVLRGLLQNALLLQLFHNKFNDPVDCFLS
jgi:hypothetical protein